MPRVIKGQIYRYTAKCQVPLSDTHIYNNDTIQPYPPRSLPGKN